MPLYEECFLLVGIAQRFVTSGSLSATNTMYFFHLPQISIAHPSAMVVMHVIVALWTLANCQSLSFGISASLERWIYYSSIYCKCFIIHHFVGSYCNEYAWVHSIQVILSTLAVNFDTTAELLYSSYIHFSHHELYDFFSTPDGYVCFIMILPGLFFKLCTF